MFINPGDIADGVLVNALWAVGQMITRPRTSRRTAAELAIASWMDTEALTRDGLPGTMLELPELSEAEAAELQRALDRDEVQGALQALLATRLTDAPETDAVKARDAVRIALYGTGYAEQLSEYFDDKVSALVADLEGRVGLASLAQIRAEAYNSRIVALLSAIERQVAALHDPARGRQAEAQWLARYRVQTRAKHGYLIPPDFDRRRRVAIADIYVPTTISEDIYPERSGATPQAESRSLTVWDLAGRLDRTVLLGDPGGGKTTAANVLMDFFASEARRKVPFLVTLRDYAANEPPERSVAKQIDSILETLYQSPAPDGVVERLLLTGRAVVIFDGLDELLDASHRRDITERVEQFCSAFPLTQVLVTSRLVGYDQARLDDDQFRCYRLGGFGDEEVVRYARKWFAVQEGTISVQSDADTRAFLVESASAADLRSNPLLLSLMCILYRGAGSLPRDRAGIYAKCAELLLGKWDDQRRIHHELRASDFVEPAIRNLAWWLFNSEDPRSAVTERELVAKTTEFLHERAFESEEEAQVAAREFVEFCHGRMWVLSDVGTTPDGEDLYAFTHRTFLEYFAAAHLAAVSDTPEDLARTLAPHVAAGEWDVVGDLAILVKDRSSDHGADRIYATLLDPAPETTDISRLLKFLLRSLESARPSPATARRLVRAALNCACTGESADTKRQFMEQLFHSHVGYDQVVADEVSNQIAAMVASDDPATRLGGLRLVLTSIQLAQRGVLRQWSYEQADRYMAAITAEARRSEPFRAAALSLGVISVETSLAMPDGFGALLVSPSWEIIGLVIPSYMYELCSLVEDYSTMDLDGDELEAARNRIGELAVVGQHLVDHPGLPWVRTFPPPFVYGPSSSDQLPHVLPLLDELRGLGFAAIRAAQIEIARTTDPEMRYSWRHLSELPMPSEFKRLFREWAKSRVNFVEFLAE